MSEAMDLEKVLSEIANAEAIKQLDGKAFEFEQDKFQAKVQAVDPKKNLRVGITQFALDADVLTVKVNMAGLLEVTGGLKQGETTIGISAVAEAQLSAAARVALTAEGAEFFLDPIIDDLDVTLNITHLTPPNLSGGKGLITKLVNLAFDNRKKAILAKLNDQLGKFDLDI